MNKIQQYQNPSTLVINDPFAYSIYKRKEQQAEYEFLKLLHQFWIVNKTIIKEEIFDNIILDDITNKKYKIGIDKKDFYIKEIFTKEEVIKKDIIIIDNITKEEYKMGISNNEFYIKKCYKNNNELSNILLKDDTKKYIYKIEIENGEVCINDDYAYNCSGEIDEWWWYACNYIWENFPPLRGGFADILNKAKIEYTPLFY